MQVVPSHIPVALCTNRQAQDAQEFDRTMVSGVGQRFNNTFYNPPLIIVGQPEVVNYRIVRMAPPPPNVQEISPPNSPPPLPSSAPPSTIASSFSAPEIIYANLTHVVNEQIEAIGEISPIRVNKPTTHFVYASNSNSQTDTVTTQSDQNYTMSTFGRNRETSV
jgi:hypothetical protein